MSGFFRHVTVPAADVGRFPDLIRRMRREEIDGIIITGVYSADECAVIRARLEDGRHGLLRTEFPAPFRSFFLGVNLNLAPEDLSTYFRNAPLFHDRLEALFRGTPDLRSRVTGLLSAMDEGRRYDPAPGIENGADHMFTTLRGHMPGGFIPQHFDNEQAHRASYRLVMAKAASDLYSFVLAFSRAEDGGALEVFNLRHQGQVFRMTDGERDARHLSVEGVESVQFRLAPGEMIMFNSGRFLHRVTPVIGSTPRWTACSFMTESRDGGVMCWG